MPESHRMIAELITAGLPRQAVQDLVSGLKLSYVKAMGLESESPPDLAVKSIGRDEIKGYSNLWGNPDRVDVEREFFTTQTDFWDSTLGLPRPLTWDHGQDTTMKTSPIVGKIVEFGNDELGRWYIAQLDRAHKYRQVIDRLVEQGLLGTSSDSAPQYVVREKAKSGAVWLKQWPLFAAALTTTPCEPRMIGTVDYFKSIGLTLPDPEASDEQARAMVEKVRLQHQRVKFYFGGLT